MNELKDSVVCVVGLGYVGLPLAEALAGHFPVIGYDTNAKKVESISLAGMGGRLSFTTEAGQIARADFVIICVPTPVSRDKTPDLSYVTGAAETVGQNLKAGATVILESTVYPGVTEDIMVPVLEKASGLVCGQDFKVAYSPERINPGDDEHGVGEITKVVAGMDEETSRRVAVLYGTVTAAVFVAKDIRTAEAAKVIENIQRDINIALVNEFSILFTRLGLDTKEVLAAAGTKWNFHAYSPGLVGGHCIPVDPYYLVHKAGEIGYRPQVILAGREINDNMPGYVVGLTLAALSEAGRKPQGARVLILGLTYKENVADTRESPAGALVRGLATSGAEVYGYDPLLDDAGMEFGLIAVQGLQSLPAVDAVIVTVGHEGFRGLTLEGLKESTGAAVLVDIRGLYSSAEAVGAGFRYVSL